MSAAPAEEYYTTRPEPQFEPFQKIARLNRTAVITEKIDGSNAQVHITTDGRVIAGSRNRIITPQDDNFGFAAWVEENRDELLKLGPGRHYGEWWGRGIQRGYGLQERRFSLFNTGRWVEGENVPACCHVVPVLEEGPFSTERVAMWLDILSLGGSVAAPGYDRPEGLVVYHTASRSSFKVTIEGDESPKSALLAVAK